jgi:O-antigen/teichoic acid export membrane protein
VTEPQATARSGDRPPAPPLTHGRRVAAGTVRVFAADALVVPTGILAAAFLTRSLGPELYGLFTVAASIVLWVETAATMLLSRAAVKFIAEADNWTPVAGRLNRVQLGVSLAAMALLMAAAPGIAAWLHAPALVPLLRLIALDIPIIALASLHRAFLIGRGDFDRVALPTAARWLVRLALVFLLVGLGLSVTGAILATLGGSLAALLVTRVFIRPSLWGHASPAIPGMWSYAIPLFSAAMATQSFNRLDLLMVKALVAAPDAAGFYGAAQNLAIGPGLLAAAFSPLLLGTLSGLARDGLRGDFHALVQQVFRLMLMLLPFVAAAAPVASELAALVYGPTFEQAGPAAGILFFAAAALFIVSITTAVLTALGQPYLAFMLVAPLAPVAVAAHLIVVPRFGPAGAASVTALLAWFAAGAGILAVARRAGVQPPLRSWMWILAITVAAAALSQAWRPPGAWVLAELTVMAAGILAALRGTGVLGAADLALAWFLVTRRRAPEADARGEI